MSLSTMVSFGICFSYWANKVTEKQRRKLVKELLSIGLVGFCHVICFSTSKNHLAQSGVGWKDVLLQGGVWRWPSPACSCPSPRVRLLWLQCEFQNGYCMNCTRSFSWQSQDCDCAGQSCKPFIYHCESWGSAGCTWRQGIELSGPHTCAYKMVFYFLNLLSSLCKPLYLARLVCGMWWPKYPLGIICTMLWQITEYIRNVKGAYCMDF